MLRKEEVMGECRKLNIQNFYTFTPRKIPLG
jgi:hypothetical protein